MFCYECILADSGRGFVALVETRRDIPVVWFDFLYKRRGWVASARARATTRVAPTEGCVGSGLALIVEWPWEARSHLGKTAVLSLGGA